MSSESLLDILGVPHTLIHGGTCAVVNVKHHMALRKQRLDSRFPISYFEVSYRTGGWIYVPQGAALGAKLLTLCEVLGPLRLEAGVSFTIPGGGGYDPRTDGAGKRVTHRKSNTSQHMHRPGTRAGGTAWDFRPSDIEERWDWYVGQLMDRDAELKFIGGRRISIGQYHPGRGTFLHIDLREGRPWRKVLR